MTRSRYLSVYAGAASLFLAYFVLIIPILNVATSLHKGFTSGAEVYSVNPFILRGAFQ